MSMCFAELAAQARARGNDESLHTYATAFRAELDARTALGTQLRAARAPPCTSPSQRPGS